MCAASSPQELLWLLGGCISSLAFPRGPLETAERVLEVVENELMTAAACLSFFLCLFVSPLRTVSCGQQHHFDWQPQRQLRVTQLLKSSLFSPLALQFSPSGCQSANVFYSLTLINRPTLSPSPHLCNRSPCMWMWMFFRSPTGTLRPAAWLVTWLLPATAG